MKSILYLIISITFVQCTSVNEYDTYISSSNAEQENRNSCLSSYSLDIENNDTPLYKFGRYHNEILDSLSNCSWGRNCGMELLTAVDTKIKDVITNNYDYSNTFGLPKSDFPLDYDILLNYCQLNSISEVDDLNRQMFQSQLAIFEDTSIFSNEEQDFIIRFFNAIAPENGQSIRPKVDLPPFYSEVINSSEDFLHDGSFSLMLLVIYDYSSCFWMDYFPSNNIAQPRALGFFAGLAVGDAVSGFVGGVKNLIRTNGTHDPNDELFTAMENAALSGSSFGIFPW